jgi:hypothetical protein
MVTKIQRNSPTIIKDNKEHMIFQGLEKTVKHYKLYPLVQ